MRYRSVKARKLLKAILASGWEIRKNNGGSHKVLYKLGMEPFSWSFHDNVEIGPKMVARIAGSVGIKPGDY